VLALPTRREIVLRFFAKREAHAICLSFAATLLSEEANARRVFSWKTHRTEFQHAYSNGRSPLSAASDFILLRVPSHDC
jgi:hypothetical protein